MSIDTNYNNGYPSSGSTDPWSSYGQRLYDMGDGSGNPYQGYEQQLLSYIQSLKAQMTSLQQGTPAYEQAIQYLNTAMSYLQQVDPQMASDPSLGGGNWDPMSSPYGSGYPGSSYPVTGSPTPGTDPNNPLGTSSSQAQPVNSFPISYQDSTHVVTDEGDTTSITLSENDPETRTIDVYQKGNTLMIPSNSANVNAVAQPDDAVSGATMVVVTYTCNGHTRTVKYHNVDRTDFKLDIQAPDKTQITLDASLTSSGFANKVTTNETGALAAMQGTPPDETDATTRTWNKNDSVDYYATEGTETDEIYADTVNITLPDRSDTAKVTKTDDHEYTVEIYDATGSKLLRTIHLHQVTGDGCINFNHLAAENLQYKDKTKGSTGGFKAWDDPSCKSDSQITVNGQAGGALAGPLDPNHTDDSVPSSISKDGTTANYNQDDDVSIHAYPDDDVKTQKISANGTVDLYPNTQDDSAEVSFDPKTGELTIKIKTKDQNGNSKTETFVVDAQMANTINLHVDPSKITYDNAANIPLDIQKKIIDGNGNDSTAQVTASNGTFDGIINSFNKEGITLTPDQIQQALTDAGLTADDLANLPVPPNSKVISFLEELDPDLKTKLDAVKSNPSDLQTLRDANDQLVKSLSALGAPYSNAKNWSDGSFPLQSFYTYTQTAGFVMVGGQVFNIFDKSGQPTFDTWKFDTSQPHAIVDPNTGAQLSADPGDSGENLWGWWDATDGKWQVRNSGSYSDAMDEYNNPDGDDQDSDDVSISGLSVTGTGLWNPNDPSTWQ